MSDQQTRPAAKRRGVLINISGVSGAGKDTIGGILHAKRGVVCLSFASPLKQIVSDLTGWPYEVLLADTEERRNARNSLPEAVICGRSYTFRTLLEYMGTDVIRKRMGDDVWINLLIRRAQKLIDEGTDVCISDARFVNEIDAMRSIGAECWCVWRTPKDLEDVAGGHVSERQFLQRLSTMKLIDNTGSRDDLENAALAMFDACFVTQQ